MQGARNAVERRGVGEGVGVSDRDERLFPGAVRACKFLRACGVVPGGAACRTVRLRQRYGVGEQVGVRVEEGGQHGGAVQIAYPAEGRKGADELPVFHGEAARARKGEHAVFV